MVYLVRLLVRLLEVSFAGAPLDDSTQRLGPFSVGLCGRHALRTSPTCPHVDVQQNVDSWARDSLVVRDPELSYVRNSSADPALTTANYNWLIIISRPNSLTSLMNQTARTLLIRS